MRARVCVCVYDDPHDDVAENYCQDSLHSTTRIMLLSDEFILLCLRQTLVRLRQLSDGHGPRLLLQCGTV